MSSALFLISLMVVMLSGLTTGLGNQSIAAVQHIGADNFAFGEPAEGQRSFGESTVTEQQRDALAATAGVDEAAIVGIAPVRISNGSREVAASAFGVDGDSFAAPVPLDAGSAAVDADLAKDNGWDAGSRITIGAQTFTITALVDDSLYSHQPVVWIDHGCGRNCRPRAAATAPSSRCARREGSTPTVLPPRRHVDHRPEGCARRDRLLHVRAGLAAPHAGDAHDGQCPGGRRVLHRLDHPAQPGPRGPQGRRRLHEVPAQGCTRPVADRARPRRRPRRPRRGGTRRHRVAVRALHADIDGHPRPVRRIDRDGMVGATAALARIVSIDPQSALATAR